MNEIVESVVHTAPVTSSGPSRGDNGRPVTSAAGLTSTSGWVMKWTVRAGEITAQSVVWCGIPILSPAARPQTAGGK